MKRLNEKEKLILSIYLPTIVLAGFLGGIITQTFAHQFISGFINGLISSAAGIAISFFLPDSIGEKIYGFLHKYIGRYVEKLFIPHEEVFIKILRDSGITTMILSREQWDEIREWYRSGAQKDYVIDDMIVEGTPTRAIRLNRDSIMEIQMLEVTTAETIFRNIREILAVPTVKITKIVYLIAVAWIIEISYLVFKGGLSSLSQFNKDNPDFQMMFDVSQVILTVMLLTYAFEAFKAVATALKGNKSYLVYAKKSAFSRVSLLPNAFIAFLLLSSLDGIANGIQLIVRNFIIT